MPKEVYNVAPIRELTVESVNRFITDLNDVLSRLSTEVATIEGVDGRTPKFEQPSPIFSKSE